jgi:lysozyme family protein
MATKNREAAICITLGYEGGYTNDAADPGGPTNFGITIHDARMYLNPKLSTKAPWTNYDIHFMKTMSKADAIEIYRSKYWAKMSNDADPAGVDLVTFDYGVNSGVGRAVPVRNKLRNPDPVAWVKAICAQRLHFLQSLRIWSTFGKGWGRRVADVEARGAKMALQGMEAPPPVVKKELEKEAQSADASKKKADGGTIATTGGTAAGTASGTAPTDSPVSFDLSSLNKYVVITLFVVAGVAIAYFIWNSYVHKQRARAYRKVASES